MKKIILCLLICALALPAVASPRKAIYVEHDPIRGFTCKKHGKVEYALVVETDNEELFCMKCLLSVLRKTAKVERVKK